MTILLLNLMVPGALAGVAGGIHCIVESFNDSVVICKADKSGKAHRFKRSEVKEKGLSPGLAVVVPLQSYPKKGRR